VAAVPILVVLDSSEEMIDSNELIFGWQPVADGLGQRANECTPAV